jgi:hypothetical protein
MKVKQIWKRFFPPLSLVILCAFSVFREANGLQLSPDSTNYITATQNLLRTGQLFVYANYPSWSMEPAVEPYTEQPFGFPFYLAPFLWIIKDPYLAAVVAQAAAIILLYGAVWVLTRDFKMGAGFQATSLLAIALFRPLAFVTTHFWSETLFIALTLWTLHFLLIARESQRPGYSWLAALGFAAAASATRAIGVLSLGIFLLAVILRLTAWRSKKLAWFGRVCRSFSY